MYESDIFITTYNTDFTCSPPQAPDLRGHFCPFLCLYVPPWQSNVYPEAGALLGLLRASEKMGLVLPAERKKEAHLVKP